MAPRAGIHAWKISWAEEPGELQSMGPQGDTTNRMSTYHILGIVLDAGLV